MSMVLEEVLWLARILRYTLIDIKLSIKTLALVLNRDENFDKELQKLLSCSQALA